MKRKGSALVFSVLMLAFFLALSLNIYFVARKKAERAGVKVTGEKTTNNINMSSSIGYQELLLAEAFVREGFPYTTSHPAGSSTNSLGFDNYYDDVGNPITSGDGFYLDLTDGTYSESYAGIQVNNFIDFFSANWKYDAVSNSDQKIIIGEETDSFGNIKRTWQSAGISDKRTQLWEDDADTLQSIGGYRFIENNELTNPISPSSSNPPSNNDDPYQATYQKEISLPSYIGSTTVDGVNFTITVTESFKSNGSEISERKITSFIVETN